MILYLDQNPQNKNTYINSKGHSCTFWTHKRKGQKLGESIKSVATCWRLILPEPPLCARTPTWTDSSSSARKESWTSRYRLPPTSSTAWRSEKALHPFPVTGIETSCCRLPGNPTLAKIYSTRSLLFDVVFFVSFTFTSPLPLPSASHSPFLLFLAFLHPSPGSSEHGEDPGDHPLPASALQPAVQGPDSERQWRGHHCHHKVGCGTAVCKKKNRQEKKQTMCFCQGGAEWIAKQSVRFAELQKMFCFILYWWIMSCVCVCVWVQSAGPHCCKVPWRKLGSLPALVHKGKITD